MVTLFVVFVILSAYSYLIYPCLLLILSRILNREWLKQDITPTVSVIISAYNEETVIDQKVRNTMALDYPEDRLEVIVSSDGSTDRTNEIVSEIKDVRLTLFAFQDRVGKTACLNRAVPEAKGEIVLFTDANSMFSRDVLTKLVRNFADPSVGLVTGWTKYGDVNKAEDTTGIYSRFEKWAKVQESSVSSCVGADGAVFAIRKELYQVLQEYDINDFVIPLNVIGQGKRVVIDPDVYCFELPSNEAGKEYRRQMRITTRTLGAIRRNLEFFDPFRYGSFTFFLLSHKIMRFLVPFFLIATFGSNLMLLGGSYFYSISLGGQLAILAIGVISMLGFATGKIGDIVMFFLVTLAAQLSAWLRTFAGISDTTWTPQR